MSVVLIGHLRWDGGARGREIGDGEEGMNGWDGWDGWDSVYCIEKKGSLR